MNTCQSVDHRALLATAGDLIPSRRVEYISLDNPAMSCRDGFTKVFLVLQRPSAVDFSVYSSVNSDNSRVMSQ